MSGPNYVLEMIEGMTRAEISSYALRLAARVAELEAETQRRSDAWVEAIGTIRAIGHAVGCEGDELAVLAAVRRMAALADDDGVADIYAYNARKIASEP